MEAFSEQMEASKPQIREISEQYVTLSMAYTYQDMDAETMAEYQGFLARPAYQTLNTAVITGFSRGYKQIVAELAKDLAEVLKPDSNADT